MPPAASSVYESAGFVAIVVNDPNEPHAPFAFPSEEVRRASARFSTSFAVSMPAPASVPSASESESVVDVE